MKEGAIVGKVYRKIRFAAIYIFAFCLMVGGIMYYVDVKGDSFGNIFVFAGFKEKKPLLIRTEKPIYGRRYHLRGLTSKGAGIYGNEEYNRAVGYVLSAIEEAGIDNTMTDYDKVAAINQYLCEKLSYAEYAAVEGYPYEKNWLPFTDYCLLSNTAVCAGYAEAFQSMCCTLGIECWYVTGNVYESNGELIGYHAWNRVVLEGKRYYMDACWNDSSGNAYFLSENGWADHKIDGEFETYRISSQVFPMPEYIPARAS